MSEGVFLEPRNQPNNSLLRSGPTTFGIAAASITQKPGQLFQFNVLNKNAATAYYVQLHDKATAAVGTDVPIWEQKLPAGSDVPTSFQLAGLYFAKGISIAISTTPAVLTLPAADDAVAYTRHTTAG